MRYSFRDIGYLPFDDEDLNTLYNKILKGEFEIPAYVTAEAADLLRRILVTDPTKRITIQEMK